MAFLCAFAAPRSKPIQFESLAHTSVASSLLSIASAATSFFTSSKPAAPTPAAAAAGNAAAASDTSSGSSDAADLSQQLVATSPAANLSLASQARTRVLATLVTSVSVDRDIEVTRIAALRHYLPFIRSIYEQHEEITDDAEKKRIARAPGSLFWSSVLQVGARPVENKSKKGGDATIVPFWDYECFQIGEELAHAYFTLGIALYQRAGSLSFHAEQLANTIPPCSYLMLLPWYAAEINAGSANADGAAAAAPVRKFNPLSYEPPPVAAIDPRPSKSASEIATIRGQIISKRREAVECLRQAAGIFEHLSEQLLPALPVPQRRMIDTMPGISAALRLLCLVHCQQHTLLSALVQMADPAAASATGKAPLSPAVMCKLLQGLVEKLSEVRSILQGQIGSYYAALEPSLHHFLRASLERARCDRLTVLALQAELAQEHGRALALLDAALASLTLLASNASEGGLPLAHIRDCNPVLSELKQATLLQAAQMQRVRERLAKDNERIYFEAIPSLDKALEAAGDPPAGGEDKPASVFLPTPLPYELPKLLPALFLNTPKAAAWTGAGAEEGLAKRGIVSPADVGLSVS